MITEDIGFDLKYYEDINVEQESFLYRLFGDYKLQRYEFYKESKIVFSRKTDDPRKIFVDITYNKKKNGPVNLFLSLGSESYADNVLSVDEKQTLNSTDESVDIYSRRFDRSMSLYIYTDNSNETILLYEVYKSLLISYTQELDLLGLKNMVVSGQDISEYPDFLPKDFFFRVLSIKFNYETSSSSLRVNKLIDCFKLHGTVVEN